MPAGAKRPTPIRNAPNPYFRRETWPRRPCLRREEKFWAYKLIARQELTVGCPGCFFFFGARDESSDGRRGRRQAQEARAADEGMGGQSSRPAVRELRLQALEAVRWRTRTRAPLTTSSACRFSRHTLVLRLLLGSPRPLHCPSGRDRPSRARPAASGSSVCPSSDFWASSQVCRPFEPCFPSASNAAYCCSCAPACRDPGP